MWHHILDRCFNSCFWVQLDILGVWTGWNGENCCENQKVCWCCGDAKLQFQDVSASISVSIDWVVATQLFLFAPPKWGRWTHFDKYIFQMGWNHQPVEICWSTLFISEKPMGSPWPRLSQGSSWDEGVSRYSPVPYNVLQARLRPSPVRWIKSWLFRRRGCEDVDGLWLGEVRWWNLCFGCPLSMSKDSFLFFYGRTMYIHYIQSFDVEFPHLELGAPLPHRTLA